MTEYTFKLDRLVKPVSRLADQLKRIKDAGLKKVMPDVYNKIKAMEKASEAVEASPAVIDDSTYEEKVKRLTALVDACNAAETAVKTLSEKPVHTPATVKKAGGSIEVTVLPDRVSKPKVKDVAGVGKQLKELSAKVASTKRQAVSDLNGFTQWYKTVSKEGNIEITIPKSITDMIEQVDKNGVITLPSDQSFAATITYEKIPAVIRTQFKTEFAKLPQNLATATGKALGPVKQQVAKNFKTWNAEFGNYRARHDVSAAEKLFKKINAYFDTQVPKLVEPKLAEAARAAMDATLPPTVRGLNPTIKPPRVDYSNFAEFGVSMPDENPADELTDGLTDGFKGLESSERDFGAAVSTVGRVYKTMQDLAGEMQKQLHELSEGLKGTKSQDPNSPQRKKTAKDMEVSINTCNGALMKCESNLDKLDKSIASAKQLYEASARDLQQNVTVDRRALQQLKESFVAAGKSLEQSRSTLKQLKDVTLKTVRAILTTFLSVDTSGEQTSQKVQAANTKLQNASKNAFKLESLQLQKDLDVAEELKSLRSQIKSIKKN